MGVNQSRYTIDEIVGKKITDVEIVEPQYDTIDYEGYYVVQGEVKIGLSGETNNMYMIGYFDDKYHQNKLTTKSIQNEYGFSTHVANLLNRTILSVNKVKVSKKCCFGEICYKIVFSDKTVYYMYFQRVTIN